MRQFSTTLDFSHFDKAKEIFEKLTLAEVKVDLPKVNTYEKYISSD